MLKSRNGILIIVVLVVAAMATMGDFFEPPTKDRPGSIRREVTLMVTSKHVRSAFIFDVGYERLDGEVTKGTWKQTFHIPWGTTVSLDVYPDEPAEVGCAIVPKANRGVAKLAYVVDILSCQTVII